MHKTVEEPLTEILKTGICAVIRHMAEPDVYSFVQAIYKGGIRCIEITLNTENAFEIIRKLAQETDIHVGAGTVMDGDSAKRAIQAGADFLVSPHTSQTVLNVGVKNSILTIPGAFTPTEIVHAYQLGARIIKVFPAGTLGPNYFSNLRGPLGDISLMATGGIGLHNLQDFFASGVDAVGIGGSLAPKEVISSRNWSAIEELASTYVQCVQGLRQ